MYQNSITMHCCWWCCCPDCMPKCNILPLKYASNLGPGTTPKPSVVPETQGHHHCLKLCSKNSTYFLCLFSEKSSCHHHHDDEMMMTSFFTNCEKMGKTWFWVKVVTTIYYVGIYNTMFLFLPVHIQLQVHKPQCQKSLWGITNNMKFTVAFLKREWHSSKVIWTMWMASFNTPFYSPSLPLLLK